MPDDPYTSNTADANPPDSPQDQAPEPAAPAVDPKELEEWRRRAEEAAEEARRAQELARMAFSYTSNTSATPPPSEPDIPDFGEIDVDDPAALKRYVAEVAEKIAEQKVKARTEELVQAYTSNQAQEMRRWAALNIQRETEELKEAGLEDILPEVEKQIKEWGIQPEAFATPGQYKSVVYYVLGKKELERKAAEARRSPNLAAPYGHAPQPPAEPPVDPRLIEGVSKKWGVPLTEDDVKGWDFDESGEVSINDVLKENK